MGLSDTVQLTTHIDGTARLVTVSDATNPPPPDIRDSRVEYTSIETRRIDLDYHNPLDGTQPVLPEYDPEITSALTPVHNDNSELWLELPVPLTSQTPPGLMRLEPILNPDFQVTSAQIEAWDQLASDLAYHNAMAAAFAGPHAFTAEWGEIQADVVAKLHEALPHLGDTLATSTSISLTSEYERGKWHDAWAGRIDGYLNTLNPLDSFVSVPDIGVRFGFTDAYAAGYLQGSIAGVATSLAIGGVGGMAQSQ